MSQLKKLKIQGFRSFGPDDQDGQVMDFELKDPEASGGALAAPLTLILGQNGCGKTTIIECLRYLTTGDTPPGSYSGKSFVHDPKVANEHTVRASVKLLFRGTDGKSYMVTRAMEATQKTKQVTVKTLDGTFTRKDADGNKNLGSKCADINAMVLNHLGVSKPILNYVIFCHQEDSNWPLEEGSKVKAKFDEIFASDKYQNCLKEIKGVRTAHMTNLRDLKKDLEYLKSDKKMAADKQRELQQKMAEIKRLQDKIAKDDQDLEPIKQELREVREVEMNYTGIIQKREKAITRLQETKKHKEDLAEGLEYTFDKEVEDEELGQMRSQIERQAKVDEKMLQTRRSDLEELKKRLGRDQNEITASMSRIAECKATQDMHGKQKKALNEKVSYVGEKLDWSESDRDPVSDDVSAMERMLQKIDSSVRDADQTAKKINQDMDAKIDDKNRELGEVEKSIAVSEDKLKKTQKDLMDKKREIAEIKKELRVAQASADKIKDLQELQDKKEKDLRSLRDSVDIGSLRKTVVEKKAEIRDLETRETNLREERKILDARQSELADINFKEEDLKSKRQQLDRLSSKARRDLEVVFEEAEGGVPALGRLKDEFNRVHEGVAREKEALKEEISELQHVVKSLVDGKKDGKKRVAMKALEVQDFDEKVTDAIGEAVKDGDSSELTLQKALDSVKEEIESAREELSRKEANKYAFEEIICQLDRMLKAKGQTSCPTCNRAFHESSEAQDLQKDLREKIKKIPDRVKAIKTKITTCAERQEKLIELSSQGQHFDELRREIDKTKGEVSRKEQEHRAKERDLSSKTDALEALETRAASCLDAHAHVLNMDGLHQQVEALEEKLGEIRSKCEFNEDFSGRSLEEAREDAERTAQELQVLRKEAEAAQDKELKTEREVNRLEKEINQFREERLKVEKRQQETTAFEKKKKELESEVDVLNEQQRELKDRSLPPLRDQEEDIKKSKNKLMAEKEKKMEKARKKSDEVKKMQGDLQKLSDEVREYEEGDNESRLSNEIKNLRELQDTKRKREADIKKNEEGKEEEEKRLVEHKSRLRDIEVNFKLRECDKSANELAGQVKRLDEQLRLLDHAATEKKKRELEIRFNDISDRRSGNTGRLKEMESTAESTRRELDQDKLRLAPKRYKEAFLSFRCEQHVIDDLEKCYKALSYSITQFHKERMDVINRIIRELWRQTYKGNDIDYIEIKTDEADPNAAIDKRRACNYRVVMRKGNNTELEMRGRCSAGQKVLASLIIRLALAETFSADCGIIALDEPTTNLDRDNIESLAEALAALVRDKRDKGAGKGGGGLQLVVITHDEDLIDRLGRQVDDQRHYYRVSRNSRGLSTITRRTIDDVNF